MHLCINAMVLDYFIFHIICSPVSKLFRNATEHKKTTDSAVVVSMFEQVYRDEMLKGVLGMEILTYLTLIVLSF